jgi:hypothetical protein
MFSLFGFSGNWCFPASSISFHFAWCAEQSQDQGGEGGKWRSWNSEVPRGKLVAFFKSSRARGREKCQDARYDLKLLKRRFQNLEASCGQWQQWHQAAGRLVS